MVVALLEEIQRLLLRAQVCSRRTGCLSLHVFVHSLMLIFSYGLAGRIRGCTIPSRSPHIEFIESMDFRGCEGGLFSVLIASGSPYTRNSVRKVGLALTLFRKTGHPLGYAAQALVA